MAHINVNFDEVPDKFEQVPAGVYLCCVEKAEQQPTKDGTKQKVVVELKVDDEANPMNGRMLYDHIGLSGKPISLKRLCMAAGVSVGPNGVDLSDLVGKHVQVRVKMRTYQDAASGETKETPSIAEYLVSA